MNVAPVIPRYNIDAYDQYNLKCAEVAIMCIMCKLWFLTGRCLSVGFFLLFFLDFINN